MGLFVGIAGVCRKQELTNLTCDNVKVQGNVYHIEIPDTKKNNSYLTSGGFEGVNLVDIVRRYKLLRLSSVDYRRLFVEFRQGVCMNLPMGINTDSGAYLFNVTRHGGWKSNDVAEGYVDSSKENNENVSKKILGEEETSSTDFVGNPVNAT
ncbi:hypothetical protein JTB14_028692 [Gonioctena quinquepunctata]|nr:hypothetical protein JTB14_028692 [Gonioctena quinquepunctata]